MKKTIAKVLAVTLALGTCASVVACNKTGEKIDKNKTQLYVNVLDVGIGDAFAYTLKSRFEAENPKVQVIITKNSVDGSSSSAETVRSGNTDIFYMQNLSLSDYVNLVNASSEYLLEITDVVTDGGANSIHTHLYETYQEFFNLGTDSAPKYYALPWYLPTFGTVYNVDLFESKHYYSTDAQADLTYEGIDCVVGTADDNYGPNGKTGKIDGVDYSWDDGLPATWGDMLQLMALMKGDGVTPFTWTPQDNYTYAWLSALWGSYEGGKNYKLLTSYDGTYTYYDENGEKQEKTIDKTNGYEMSGQNGKLAAISASYDIVANEYYDKGTENQAMQTNKVAQESYLYSISENKPIAFLMEGAWWENEAKNTFDELEQFYGEKGYGEKKFAYLPFPKFLGVDGVPDQVNENVTLSTSTVKSKVPAVLISKGTKNPDIAKKFLQFAYSEAMNAQFTADTGVAKPFAYDMSEQQLNALTYYQRNVYELTQNPSVELVSGLSRSEYMINGATIVESIAGFKWGNRNDPILEFQTDKSITVQAYMNGARNNEAHSVANWNNGSWMKK